MYRLSKSSYRADEEPRSFVEGVTDPQRLPAEHPLTAEQVEEKGRVADNEALEAAGRQVMKIRSRMRRLLAELEDQQNSIHEIVPWGPGLLSVIDRAFGRSDEKWNLVQAVHDLVAWKEVLSNIDDRHRAQEHAGADAEMFRNSSIPWDSQIAIGHRSTGPRARMERRVPPTPLADELPDGVDDLSPEARRTVLDLLRVLVVAETGARDH